MAFMPIEQAPQDPSMMGGLLDFIKTPAGQGLLSAVAGGMAGARRGQPINSLGKAGLAGVIGYGRAQDNQREMEQFELQKQQRNAQMAEQLRLKQAMDNLRVNVPEADRSVFDAAPQEYIKNMPQFQKPATPVVKDFYEGGNVINKQWNTKTNSWDEVGRGPRFNPKGEGGSATPYFTPIYDATRGAGTLNARTGKIEFTSPAPIIRPQDSPEVQGAITGAKEQAKLDVEGAANLPKAISNAEVALKQSDELLKHPGFKQAVGGSSLVGIQYIPGTDAKDFMNRLEQLKGGAFLTAFETLKGGGQITEVEGKKATAAIARMDNATSESEFKSAVKDYQDVIRKAANNAKMRAGNRAKQSAKPDASVLDQADAILRGGQ